MANAPILTVEHVSFGKRDFRDLDQIEQWILAEKQYWAWGKFRPEDCGFQDFGRRDYMKDCLNRAQGEVAQYRSTQSRGHLTMAAQILNQYLEFELSSKSPRAKFIASLRGDTDEGMLMAQAALSTYLGDPLLQHPTNQLFQYRYASLRGRIAMVDFDLGLKPSANDLVAKGIKDIVEENTLSVANMVQQYTSKIDDLNTINQQTREENGRLISSLQTSVNAEIEKMLSAKDEAVSACAAAKAFYTTDMEIRAPINYWTEERDTHKWAARIWGFVLVLYAVMGSLALAYTLNKALDYAASNSNEKLSHTDFLVTGTVAVIITVLFWIARFLSRLYLSERHMRIDAASRVTMAKTFLALAANKNVDEKDRGLVLAPLFRPGTDGIIKEDTGVDSVLGMVARALERPSKGN